LDGIAVTHGKKAPATRTSARHFVVRAPQRGSGNDRLHVARGALARIGKRAGIETAKGIELSPKFKARQVLACTGRIPWLPLPAVAMRTLQEQETSVSIASSAPSD
jgi:hypothetical protein